MPGKQRNLEVRAIDTDPEATLHAALELGAEDHGFMHSATRISTLSSVA
jgi:hypothetical protein